MRSITPDPVVARGLGTAKRRSSASSEAQLAPRSNSKISIYEKQGTSCSAYLEWAIFAHNDESVAFGGTRPSRPNIWTRPRSAKKSLKAIFQFGSAETKKSLNANTVTLIIRHHRRHLRSVPAPISHPSSMMATNCGCCRLFGRGSVQKRRRHPVPLQGRRPRHRAIPIRSTISSGKGFAKDIKEAIHLCDQALQRRECMSFASTNRCAVSGTLDGKTIQASTFPNGGHLRHSA